MEFIDNLQVYGEDFSITDKLKEFTINEDFKNKTDLWNIVQNSCEDIGSVLYEKLINFVKNTKDLDYCNLHALYSIAKELDVGDSFSYDLKYPHELDKAMNIFSLNPSHLYKNKTMSDAWLQSFKQEFPLRTKAIEGENSFKSFTTDLYANKWSSSNIDNAETSAYIKYEGKSYTSLNLPSTGYVLTDLQSTFEIIPANKYDRFYFSLRLDESSDRVICIHGLCHVDTTSLSCEVELFDYNRVGNQLLEVEGTLNSIGAKLQFDATLVGSNLTLTPKLEKYGTVTGFLNFNAQLIMNHITSAYKRNWNIATNKTFEINKDVTSYSIYTICAYNGASLLSIFDVAILRDTNNPDYWCALKLDVTGFSNTGYTITNVDNAFTIVNSGETFDIAYIKLASIPFETNLMLDDSIKTYALTYGSNEIASADEVNSFQFQTKRIAHYENGLFNAFKFDSTNTSASAALTFGEYDVLQVNNGYNSKLYYNSVLSQGMIHETSTNTNFIIPADRQVVKVKQYKDIDSNKMSIVMDAFNSFFMPSTRNLKLIKSFPEDFNYSTLCGSWERINTNTFSVTAIVADISTDDIINISPNTTYYTNDIDKEILSSIDADENRYRISEILEPGLFKVIPISGSGPTLINNKCIIKINSQIINLIEKSIYRLLHSKLFEKYDEYKAMLTQPGVNGNADNLGTLNKIFADKILSDRSDYTAFIDSILKDIKHEEIPNSTKNLKFSEILKVYDAGNIAPIKTLLEKYLRISTKILRTICTKASLMRDIFKYVAQKHAVVGTATAIQKVLQEYILRSYTNKSDWRFDVNSLSSVDGNSPSALESELPFLTEFAAIRNGVESSATTIKDNFKINIVEYKDSTEYFNVSTQSAINYVVTGNQTQTVGHRQVISSNFDIVSTPITASVPLYGASGYVIPETARKNERYWESTDTSINSDEDVDIFYTNLNMNFIKTGNITTEIPSASFHAAMESLLTSSGGIYDTYAPSGLNRDSTMLEMDYNTGLLQYSDMNDLQNLYSANSTNDLYSTLNHKNVTYPTMASQPWLYNFVESIMDEYPKLIPSLLPSELTNSENIEFQIDDNGVTIDSWRNSNQEFIGYQTFYEESANLNYQGKSHADIDRDGPMKLSAMGTFLSESTTGSAMQAEYSQLYSSYNNNDATSIWETYYKPILTQTASVYAGYNYREELIGLKDKIITQYAVDGYGNHYMLYKDKLTDDNEEPDMGHYGDLWVRLAQHPLPYKLSSTKDANIDDVYCTIDSTLTNMNIHHFEIFENIIVIYASTIAGIKQLIICEVNYKFSDLTNDSNLNKFQIDLIKIRPIELEDTNANGINTTDFFLGCYNTLSNIVFVFLKKVIDGSTTTQSIRIQYFDIDNYTKVKKSETSTCDNIYFPELVLLSTTPTINNWELDTHYPCVWTSSYDKFYSSFESLDGTENKIVTLEFDKLNPLTYKIYVYDTFNVLQ